MTDLRIAFAGDRDIAVWVLEFLLDQDVRPLALIVSGNNRASHVDRLRELCPFLTETDILVGGTFRGVNGIRFLQSLDLDYIIGVHFPYIIPESVLNIPRFGVLNLHPAYLPYNRGWHTPSWAILEGTPIGATLHFMDKSVDTGDIILRNELQILPNDTADSLYRRLKELEFETFKEAWPQLVDGTYKRIAQRTDEGTMRKREELFSAAVQQIDLNESVKAGDLLRRLRALTTNDIQEAAYYESGGKRYRVQVLIEEEDQQ